MSGISSITLNDQHKYVLNLMEKTSENLLLMGKAGTGKSTLLNFFRKHSKKNVVVLAPTGVAALNVQGETIHSFFRFKPTITVDDAYRKGLRTSKANFFRSINIIVIDEISMVRADLFDCIDSFLRGVLKNERPFGGIQMILIGDLYQLAPVVTSEEKIFFEKEYSNPHFFSSLVFAKPSFCMRFVELNKVYRQKDMNFVQILNAIRDGSFTGDHLNILNQRVNTTYEKQEGDIYLTSTNIQAYELNIEQLKRLPSKSFHFEAEIRGDFNPKLAPADSTLTVAEGAQVMLLNNEPGGAWVNGSIGKIVKIDPKSTKILVQLKQGSIVLVEQHTWIIYKYCYDEETKKFGQKEQGAFVQYPLKLAWAVTIHKSQGMTFNRVIVDMGSGAFAQGQTYVGLSRCRTFDGLILKKPLKQSDILVDQSITQFLSKIKNNDEFNSGDVHSKIECIQQAIDNDMRLKLVYRRVTGQKLDTIIIPQYVGLMLHQKKTYIGVRGYCLPGNEDRIFAVDRIVSIKAITTLM